MQVALSTVTPRPLDRDSSKIVTLVNRERRSTIALHHFKVFYRSWNAMKNKSLDRVKKISLARDASRWNELPISIDRSRRTPRIVILERRVCILFLLLLFFSLSLAFPLIHGGRTCDFDGNVFATVSIRRRVRERFSRITGRGNISLKFFKGMEPSRHSRPPGVWKFLTLVEI